MVLVHYKTAAILRRKITKRCNICIFKQKWSLINSSSNQVHEQSNILLETIVFFLYLYLWKIYFFSWEWRIKNLIRSSAFGQPWLQTFPDVGWSTLRNRYIDKRYSRPRRESDWQSFQNSRHVLKYRIHNVWRTECLFNVPKNSILVENIWRIAFFLTFGNNMKKKFCDIFKNTFIFIFRKIVTLKYTQIFSSSYFVELAIWFHMRFLFIQVVHSS